MRKTLKKAKQLERRCSPSGAQLITLEQTIADELFAVLQRALGESRLGKCFCQIVRRRGVSKAPLRCENSTHFIFKIGALGRVRVVLVAITLAIGEFRIVRQHVAERTIFCQPLARGFHRLFHFRCFISGVGPDFVL